AATTGSGDDGAGAAGLVAEAEAALGGVAGVDRRLDELGARLAGAALELSDVAGELRAFTESIEAEPGMLEHVEERLASLDRLKRKHGGTIESVLEHAERCRAEIARLENAESLADELRERLERERAERRELGTQLSAGRAEAAP